jgi:hypothetical protein
MIVPFKFLCQSNFRERFESPPRDPATRTPLNKILTLDIILLTRVLPHNPAGSRTYAIAFRRDLARLFAASFFNPRLSERRPLSLPYLLPSLFQRHFSLIFYYSHNSLPYFSKESFYNGCTPKSSDRGLSSRQMSESPDLFPSAPSHKHTNPRRKFTIEEDNRLRALVAQMGNERWDSVAHEMPGRTARQCRDRYKNYLLSSLLITPWTPEEDALLRRKYAELGPKWVEISRTFRGRSGNDVKNRWNRHISKSGSRCLLPSLSGMTDSITLPALTQTRPAQADSRASFPKLNWALP